MVKDDHNRPVAKATPALLLAVLVLTIALGAIGLIAARWLRPAQEAPASASSAAEITPEPGQHLFRNWPKPDVAVVLSGQQYGYLQPCGCSEPQKGGLARRFNMMQLLRQHGWPVVAGDLGDIAQGSGPHTVLRQTLLKYRKSMDAHRLLGYSGVGIGANEMSASLPLFQALGEYALNERSPRVLSANLKDKENKFPEMVGSTIVSAGQDGAPRVGFVGIVGPSVAKRSQDPDARFEAEEKVLPSALAALQQQGAELLVLLYQGSVEEAKACAQQYPRFHVILRLNAEEEPSAQPDQVGNTLIVGVGHKGRYVGVVGAYRSKVPSPSFQLRYQLVALDPEYETPEGKEKENPIHALLQSYAEEVRKGNYLAEYIQNARHPVQIDFPNATYVGSAKCQKCHEAEYAIWEASPHPHAYEALEKAKRPTLRQYDGECVRCHVIGFGYASGFRNEKDTPLLKGVGCESCHGPASLHVAQHKDKQLRAVLNPWKRTANNNAQALANRIQDMCQKCHDPDNSTNFKFQKYWEQMKIKH
jgi:hypothetical protein